MKLRKTILATLAAAALLTGCVKAGDQLNNADTTVQKDYENNNFAVSEKTLENALASVEKIRVEQNWITKGDCVQKLGPSVKDEMFGSATVIKEDADYQYLLTAYHLYDYVASLPPINEECAVKEGGIRVLINEKDARLEIVDYDKKLDFLYLKAKKSDELTTFEGGIGNSDHLKQGDFVYSVGYPWNTKKVLQEGIVTATTAPVYFGKFLLGYNDKQFMFSAPTDPGCSGGPVFVSYKGNLELAGIGNLDSPYSDAYNIGVKINPIMENIKDSEEKIKAEAKK